MNFINFYQNYPDKLEKRKLRNKIIETCKIQHSSFYSWLHRNKIPPLAQEKICEIIGKPQSELFPESEKIKENGYEALNFIIENSDKLPETAKTIQKAYSNSRRKRILSQNSIIKKLNQKE